ncbi:hypothetical protein ACWIG5_33135, partial [Streptomyces lydicus]
MPHAGYVGPRLSGHAFGTCTKATGRRREAHARREMETPRTGQVSTCASGVNRWAARAPRHNPGEVFRPPYDSTVEALFDGAVTVKQLMRGAPGTLDELLTAHGRKLTGPERRKAPHHKVRGFPTMIVRRRPTLPQGPP